MQVEYVDDTPRPADDQAKFSQKYEQAKTLLQEKVPAGIADMEKEQREKNREGRSRGCETRHRDRDIESEEG